MGVNYTFKYQHSCSVSLCVFNIFRRYRNSLSWILNEYSLSHTHTHNRWPLCLTKVCVLPRGIYIFKEILHETSVKSHLPSWNVAHVHMSIHIKPVTAMILVNAVWNFKHVYSVIHVFMTLRETSRWVSPVGLGNSII